MPSLGHPRLERSAPPTNPSRTLEAPLPRRTPTPPEPRVKPLLILLLAAWGAAAAALMLTDVATALLHPPGPIPYR